MKEKIIAILLILVIFLFVGFKYVTNSNAFSYFKQNDSVDWNLILVNSNNPLPKNYNIELTKLSNGTSVDKRIYPSLQQMFDDARIQGVNPIVREGYRTREEQEKIMQSRIKQYISEGYSKTIAKNEAHKWVAEPGTSEHELGLAVDINAGDGSSSEQVYCWLEENAHKYGFILRYPNEKKSITGIDYEPWHYRYVGIEAAQKIYNKKITLEEYLKENS